MRIAILTDNAKDNAKKWILACQKKQLEYTVISLLDRTFYEKINSFQPDFCLLKPPGDILANKLRYDKNLLHLKLNGVITYPSYEEVKIYENKKALSIFLVENSLPHSKTRVYEDKKTALEFAQKCSLPIVGKTIIGAAGSGVEIIKERKLLIEYIETAFNKGVSRRVGPNRKTGNPIKWTIKAIKSPKYFFNKLKEYKQRNDDKQIGVVILQDFIPHQFEWRCVKIGESFFAYKKLNLFGKASGSKVFEYGKPPKEILDFTKELCETFNFNFMAVDVFQHNKSILINELQTIFGHKNSYICKVNDKIGRYFFSDGDWVFEEGDFNTNESYDLRLKTAIDLFKKEDINH